MQEEWKSILDYPNYEVSSFGNVRNSKTGRILKPIMNGPGYYQVVLYDKNNYHKKYLIHRLVAKAFLPNPENKPEVDHIDRNRTNNKITNLRWTTQSENMLNTKSLDRPLFGIYKNGNGFRVMFTIHQKEVYFGHRKTLEEAIILRDNTFATLRNTNPSGVLQ